VGTSPKRRFRHRVRDTVPRLSRFAIEHLLLLPLGAIIALVWVNTAPESYYDFTFSIAFVVNDVGIAFFFALIAKEVVEATVPGGVLHPWRRAMMPIVASLGATAVPAFSINVSDGTPNLSLVARSISRISAAATIFIGGPFS